MFKRDDHKQLFFSTKVELEIDGVKYRPSICYSVPPLAKKSLEKYVEAGKVIFYTEKVRFVNGAAVAFASGQMTEVPSVIKNTPEAKTSRRNKK